MRKIRKCCTGRSSLGVYQQKTVHLITKHYFLSQVLKWGVISIVFGSSIMGMIHSLRRSIDIVSAVSVGNISEKGMSQSSSQGETKPAEDLVAMVGEEDAGIIMKMVNTSGSANKDELSALAERHEMTRCILQLKTGLVICFLCSKTVGNW